MLDEIFLKLGSLRDDILAIDVNDSRDREKVIEVYAELIRAEKKLKGVKFEEKI